MKNMHKWERNLLIVLAVAVAICLSFTYIKADNTQTRTLGLTGLNNQVQSSTTVAPPVGPKTATIINNVVADKKDQLAGGK